MKSGFKSAKKVDDDSRQRIQNLVIKIDVGCILCCKKNKQLAS